MANNRNQRRQALVNLGAVVGTGIGTAPLFYLGGDARRIKEVLDADLFAGIMGVTLTAAALFLFVAEQQRGSADKIHDRTFELQKDMLRANGPLLDALRVEAASSETEEKKRKGRVTGLYELAIKYLWAFAATVGGLAAYCDMKDILAVSDLTTKSSLLDILNWVDISSPVAEKVGSELEVGFLFVAIALIAQATLRAMGLMREVLTNP